MSDDEGLDFDDIEEEIVFFTWNRGHKRRPVVTPKPPSIAKVLEEKQAKREEERCKVCGSLKVKHKGGLIKQRFRLICAKCKNDKRNARRAAQRNAKTK